MKKRMCMRRRKARSFGKRPYRTWRHSAATGSKVSVASRNLAKRSSKLLVSKSIPLALIASVSTEQVTPLRHTYRSLSADTSA